MTGDPYNALVRDCFRNPEHMGDVADNDAVIAYFDDQGMRVRLSARVGEGCIRELRFRAWGCPHVIAAAEAFCRRYDGQPVTELEAFETGQIMRDLAVPVEKTGRILVFEDTVRSLRAAIQDRISS